MQPEAELTVRTDAPIKPVPHVTCPTCGNEMRLAETLTDKRGTGMIFYDCPCGFEYMMPA
jgi:hypothetical protein